MHRNNTWQRVVKGNAIIAMMLLIVASGLGGCTNHGSTNELTKNDSDESNYESNPISVEVSAKEAIELACADAVG
ncbi:MAG: hypothetical protein LBS24_03885, partial [Clostridiales Family XIII bacterium]|nr:hypothetical protein [Clostridiales Family XIII bacterium]